MHFKLLYSNQYHNKSELELIKQFLRWQGYTYSIKEVDASEISNMTRIGNYSSIVIMDHFSGTQFASGFDEFYVMFKGKGMHKV